MNDLVKINNKDLHVKECSGQRVVTFKDIDNLHERVEGTAKRNFNSNKKHFVRGIDYFLVKPADVEEYEIRTAEINNAGTYLITESGYLMLVKSLQDDLAWSVQRDLVNNYFRVKNENISLNQLSPELQAFKQIFDSMAKQELEQRKLKAEVVATKEEIAAVREVITINPKVEWRKETNKLISKICYKLQDYKSPKDEIYKALDQRAGCNLKTRLNNLRGRAFDNCWSQTKINNLNYLDVIADDRKLIEIYIAIVKEMAIKNGIRVKEVI